MRWPQNPHLWDRILAVVLAMLTAALVLWQPGPRPEDLIFEVVSVRELQPPGQELGEVAVTVRWQWHRPPDRVPLARVEEAIAVAPDWKRWAVDTSGRDQWRGGQASLFAALQEPPARYQRFITPGESGTLTITLVGRENGRHYRAGALPLRLYFVHRVSGLVVPPGSTWVKPIEGVFRVEPAE